ncbi:phosphomannomutase [Kluyvera ascorbata]|uniref:phosphomannomutase n=1 Tax=Kluyvera ascorbata TaxID=51288 RepID=UPI0039F643BD
MLNTKTVIRDSGIAFGTSGARGLVTQFSHEACAAFVHSFLHVIEKKFQFQIVSLAIDNRPSSYEIAQVCALAIEQHGYSVEFHGVIPTPALAYFSMKHERPCIMVTGSHIPFDRNGLKFYRPDGEITKDDEFNIVNSDCYFTPIGQLRNLVINKNAAESYILRYTSLFSENELSGKRIGIYEHSSAGRDIYLDLFSQLGAEVISIGRSDHFVPIDTEAVSDADRISARHWVQEYNLDAIFSTDGDGDRPLVADERGEWLRGDILGLVAATGLNIKSVAVPVNSSTAIELSDNFSVVNRTKIGSPYVIAAFADMKEKYDAVAGFEANGGFLLASDIKINSAILSALPTRDAVLPALIVFVLAGHNKISHLLDKLPKRFSWSDRLQNFPSELSNKILTDLLADPCVFLKNIPSCTHYLSYLDKTDGVRIHLDNGDIIHLRPSGNAPELRCYTEASDESQAKKYVAEVFEYLISTRV